MPKGKKLKREDYPDVSDEDFEWMQKINNLPVEGSNFE